MKKILPISAIATMIAMLVIACNRSPQSDANSGKNLNYTDTIGLADFQKWKALNELKDPTVYYQQGNEMASRQPTRTVVKYVRMKSSAIRARRSTYSSSSTNSVGQYPAKSVKRVWSSKVKGA